MKKGVKKKAKKSSVKAARRIKSSRRSGAKTTVIYRRVFYFGSLFGMLLLFTLVFNRSMMRQAVQGMSITRSLYAQATVEVPTITGAVSYNIYYKKTGEKEFIHAARELPATIRFYTISYLNKGTDYDYRISALDSSGSEFWWSPIKPLSNIESM